MTRLIEFISILSVSAFLSRPVGGDPVDGTVTQIHRTG